MNIITRNEYTFKNYTILNDYEKKIVLRYRNENRFWMINNNIISLDEHLKWIDSLKSDDKKLYFLVLKDDVPFMSIYYHDIDCDDKTAYWGYFLGNKEYSKEVLKIEKLIIEIAFEELNLEELFCITNIENSVIKIHKFFGFKEIKQVLINEKYFLKMGISKKTWNSTI